jgi:methionyl-tRNA formyltransferase
VPAIEQDHATFRFFHRSPPDEGSFDWNRPATRVSAFIRAFDYHPLPSPWGYATTFLKGMVIDGRLVPAASSGV